MSWIDDYATLNETKEDLNDTPTADKNKARAKDFNDLRGAVKDIANLLLPVGSLILGTTAPTIGTWEDQGELWEGQAIIGGSSTDGDLIRHKHQWGLGADYGREPTDQLSDSRDRMQNIKTYANDGSVIDKWPNNTPGSINIVGEAFTNFVGTGTDGKNKAYGLGVGSGIHIWKRTE